jgi:predicted GNAT family acetyltransferase
MQAQVVHNEADHRYELVADGAELGFAEYRLGGQGQVAEFHHTVIHPQYRDQGHAEQLVQGALDDVRARGLTVVASCWYVDQFLIEHPDYAGLRA